MTSPYTIGLQIAGFRGTERFLGPSIARVGTVDETTVIGSVITYYLRALAEVPSLSSSELDVYEGGPSQTSFEFNVVGITEAPNGLGLPTMSQFENVIPVQLFRYLKGGRAKPWFTLSGAISATTLTIPVSELNTRDRAPQSGDIIYIGREAMLVSSYSTGTIGIVSGQRGAFGTSASTHIMGSEIFVTPTNNPLRVDREVDAYFFEPDSSSPEEIRWWRGFIEDAKIVDGMRGLSVQCVDIFGMLGERRLGAGRMQGEAFVRVYNDKNIITFADDSPTDEPPLHIYITQGSNTLPHMMFEIDGFARPLMVSTANGFAVTTSGFVSAGPTGLYVRPPFRDSSILAATSFESLDPGERERIECHEILSTFDETTSYFKDGAGNFSNHPVDIMLCILQSTGTATWGSASGHSVGTNGARDWLPKRWGLAVDVADIALSTFLNVKNELASMTAPFLWLGQGGDEPDAAEVLYSLAQCMGAYLYRTPFGKIGLGRFFDPGPRNVDRSFTSRNFAPGDFSDTTRNERPIRQLKMELGQRYPGSDPAQIVRVEDMLHSGLPAQRYLTDVETLESTRVLGDAVTGRLTGTLENVLLRAHVYRWEARQGQLPRYALRLAGDASHPITSNGLVVPGEWVKITHPAIPNQDGTAGIKNHRCLVIKADFDGPTHQQRIVVEDHAYVTGANSIISPCWRVSSVTSATEFSVDATFSATSLLVTSAEYILTDSQGNPRDTTARTATISGTALSLGVAWSVTPAVGDIVEIATYDDATDWLASGTSDVDHTWFADAKNQLGTANADAQLWGV